MHHTVAEHVPEFTHIITMSNDDKNLLCFPMLPYYMSYIDTQVRVFSDAALDRNNTRRFNAINGLFDNIGNDVLVVISGLHFVIP